MSQHHDQPDTPRTVEELVDAMIDGHLDEAGMRRLDELIATDDAARDHYVDALMAHSMLRVELRASDTPIALSRPSTPSTDASRDAVAGRIDGTRSWTRFAAAAAILLVAIGVIVAVLKPGGGGGGAPGVETRAAVATLVDTHDAVWAEHQRGMEPGDDLPAGALALRAGAAQIVMRSGAVVDLIGPTTFHVTGENAGRLDAGRLITRVPHSAIGFAVATPHTTVTDLGTEFGLIADTAAGSTQVHVFEGLVEMTGPRGNQRLEAGRAVDVTATGANPIAADRLSFRPEPNYVADVLRTRPIGYWRFDNMEDGVIANLANPDTPATMVGPSQLFNGPELGPRVDRVERANAALHLDGDGYAVVGDFAAFERDDAFSYGGWVRVRPGPQQSAILSRMDAPKNYRGYDLLIADNLCVYVHISSDFPSNAIRVKTAPMTPDAWHHVLVTYDGSSMAAGVGVYIDGERVATEVLENTLTGSIRTPVPFVLCRRTGVSAAAVPALVRGEVDEIVIYDRALTPDEARTIAGAGRNEDTGGAR